jgi:hypothetical protein
MVNLRCNVSGHPKSSLRQFRESIAGRKLTEQEAYSFDDQEVVGVRVGFLCEHKEGGNGQIYPNVKAIWRLPEERQREGKIHNVRWDASGGDSKGGEAQRQAGAGDQPHAQKDDLPF